MKSNETEQKAAKARVSQELEVAQRHVKECQAKLSSQEEQIKDLQATLSQKKASSQQDLENQVFEAKQQLRDLNCKHEVQKEQLRVYEQETVPAVKLELSQVKHKLSEC